MQGLHAPKAPRSCDLCGEDRFETIATRDRNGAALDTVICQTCGLVGHRQLPTDEQLRSFYADEFRPLYNRETSPSHRRIMRAWKNGQRIAHQVGPLFEPGTSVLEVGAGIGCTVKVFEERGFVAEGIDLCDTFLQFARTQLHANVTAGDLSTFRRHKQFQAVLLIHVIEHFRSPKEALDQICEILQPGGLVYIECPNLQAPFARRRRLFHFAHVHNFVPSTLQMLLQSSGFRLRKRFGGEGHSNLQMLFQHTGERRLTVDPGNYERTLRDLRKSDVPKYHLRRSYLSERIRKSLSYAHEYFFARSFVRQLSRKFEQPDTAEAASRAA